MTSNEYPGCAESDNGWAGDWENDIARYVLQNYDAQSVIMSHYDLAGIDKMGSGDTANLPTLLARYKPHIVVDENGVGQIAESALQELYHLDASAPEFCDRLDNFLHSQEYDECVLDLDSVDLTGLANYLDKALCSLQPSSRAFEKCELELKRIYGIGKIHRAPYTISSDLQTVDPDPAAPTSDVLRGATEVSQQGPLCESTESRADGREETRPRE